MSVADLDLDGALEIVGGNQAWRHDGTVFFSNGGYDGFPAIGNFDTDPYPEIVMVSYGTIYLLEHDGSEKWSVEHPGSGPGGPPAVADFDGDGEAEIGVAGKLLYAVIDGDGGILWTAPIMDSSSAITSSAVFDFEGDGAVEVLHNDHHYLRVFRGSDGTVLFETPNPTCTLTENPVVADVDGDGEAEIVAARNQMCGYGSQVGVFDQGIFVYGSPEGGWAAARRVWNEHGYHVTNVRDDLTIPAVEARGWLEPGLNVYRAQAAGPAQQADLTTSRLRIDASGCPAEVGIAARIGNGGAVDAPPVPVAFYLGHPDAGALLGVVATGAELGPGELVDLTLRTAAIDGAATICVAADDDGTRTGGVSECNEVNNLLCVDFVGFCNSSDLEIAVTDGQTAAAPGTALTYTITVANHGPADVDGATVSDVFPPSLVGVSWTCTPSGAATCTPGPVTGDLADQVAIAAGAAVTYTATGTLGPDAAGTVVNTAQVTSPHVDPNPGNESAGDETVVFDQADLAIAVTDGQTAAQPGSAITYTITVVNHGPNAAVAGLVADRFPAALLAPSWSCQATGGAVCTPGPVAEPIHDPVELPSGSSLVYTVAATIDPGATGTLSNRALVTATTFDPDPANNLAVDQTGLASQSDLVVTAVDVSGLVTHAQTLAASGTVAATAGNVGFAPAESGFSVLLFADRNHTGAYEEGADLVLGEELVTGGLAVGVESTVAV
ncbi:MAG: DUF11 domain-containing protein, partial [bacterium]|nr:DUF11 domain-containing protein [bacterium]